MKTILFIPFTAHENNFSLFMRALNWRFTSRKQGDESYEDPGIVIYKHPDEQEQDYEDYTPAQFKFTEDNIDDNTVIYVLADGYEDPHSVINVNNAYYQYHSEKPYRLFIGAVAWRMKECGLTPGLAQQLKSIKLFVCDGNNTNSQLANYFAQGLGEPYNEVTINYYSAILNIPQLVSINEAETKAKKLAFHLSGSSGKLVPAGYANEHRHSLMVGDALVQPKSRYSSTELEQSKAHPLPTFRELTASIIESVEEILDTESLQQEYPVPVITSLDDGEDTVSSELEEPVNGSHPVKTETQCTAIVVWQERSIYSFFKFVDNSAGKTLVKQSAIHSDSLSLLINTQI